MPNTAQLIIQAIIDKKPLDVQEYVTEMMTEAASGMIQEKTVVYQDPEEFDDEFEDTDDDISDEELAGFFEDFHDEYGHLPEDEQLALMADFEAQLQEDNADNAQDLRSADRLGKTKIEKSGRQWVAHHHKGPPTIHNSKADAMAALANWNK